MRRRPSPAPQTLDGPNQLSQASGGGLPRSVLRLEFGGNSAARIGMALAVVGTVLLLSKQPPFQGYNTWSSTWADAARWLSVSSLVLAPLVATAAAWVGGRERRRRMDELLKSTSRPEPQRLLLSFACLLVGVAAGFLAYAAVVAAAIAPTVAYGGGGWKGAWLLVGLGWVTAAGVGFGAGRLVPGRLIAPATGLGLYILCGAFTYIGGAWGQLAPAAQLPTGSGRELVPGVVPGATIWFLGLTVTALLLVTSRRRPWVSLLPLIAAVGAAAVLLNIGDAGADSSRVDTWVQADPAATSPVCSTDGGPEVCVFAEHAGHLQATTDVARQLLATSAELLAIDRAAEVNDPDQAPPDTLPIPNLSGQSRAFRDGLARPGDLVQSSIFALVVPRCRLEGAISTYQSDINAQAATAIASTLLGGEPFVADFYPSEAASLVEHLSRDRSAAREWMQAYLTAARACDVTDLGQLSRAA